MEEKYRLELTAKEVKNIGEKRWSKGNQHWAIWIFITLGLLITFSIIMDDGIIKNIVLIALALVALAITIIPVYMCDKHGKLFLESVKGGKQN